MKVKLSALHDIAKGSAVIQHIIGVKEDSWYGPVTMAAMREWQAKHLPDLPEANRGYVTRHFWDKAIELGLLEIEPE